MYDIIFDFLNGAEFSLMVLYALWFYIDRNKIGVDRRVFSLCTILMSFTAVMVAWRVLYSFGLLGSWVDFHQTHLMINVLNIPFSYYILIELTHFFRNEHHFLRHFLLFLIILLCYLLARLCDSHWTSTFFYAQMFYTIIYMVYINIFIIRAHHLYHRELENYYADIEGRTLNWFYVLLFLIILKFCCYGLVFVTDTGETMEYVKLLRYLLPTIVWGAFGYNIHRLRLSPEILEQMEKEAQEYHDIFFSTPEASSSSSDVSSANADLSHGPSSPFPLFAQSSYVELSDAEAQDIIRRLDRYLSGIDLLSAENMTREDFAHAIGTNHLKLAKALRVCKGMTLAAYVTDFRIEHAAFLLRTTDDTIEKVFLQSGYNTRPAFYRAFSSKYRCTPNEYRQRIKYAKKKEAQ